MNRHHSNFYYHYLYASNDIEIVSWCLKVICYRIETHYTSKIKFQVFSRTECHMVRRCNWYNKVFECQQLKGWFILKLSVIYSTDKKKKNQEYTNYNTKRIQQWIGRKNKNKTALIQIYDHLLYVKNPSSMAHSQEKK